MFGDEAVEQPDAEGGGALRHGRRVLFRPGDAGDVEMRPRHVVDKALQELRADDAAGGAVAGDVLDVGGVAVDRAVIAFGERQPPELARRPPCRRRSAARRARRCWRTARHARWPSATMTAPVRVARSTISFGLKRSWQYHSTSARTSRPSASVFNTSIVWPDIERDDVARPLRGARRHVLDQPDDADRVDLGLARGEQAHQPDDHAGAGHVPFHVAHAGGRLDRDAAGVEGDALADKGERAGCRRRRRDAP